MNSIVASVIKCLGWVDIGPADFHSDLSYFRKILNTEPSMIPSAADLWGRLHCQTPLCLTLLAEEAIT